MPTLTASDGTDLHYAVLGDGDPVVCLPGGPMQDCSYLGDLGGLSARRALVMVDPRGTGRSATPADPASYRCDRQVDDVEALRRHRGLDQLDLLAHSAGTNLAALYVARYPERVRRLVLVTPSSFAVGIEATGRGRLDVAALRKDEPWFPDAFAALEDIVAGNATDAHWEAIDPFFYGRWDAAARAHLAAQAGRQNGEAAAAFGTGAFDPPATRAALAGFTAPVLLLAGELDLNSAPSVVAEYAGLFPSAELVVHPGAGHYPWLDDPGRFVESTAAFLA